jgi:protein-S-isoprenylcysteine O-methyltransferase Ste14
MLIAAMFLLGCLMVGLATIVRVWCALYIAGYKDDVLVTEGPYSICSNPLYFFNFLEGTGVGFCSESLI